MPVIPVRRWSSAVGALALAAVAIVAPAGPAQAAVGCEVDYTGVNTPPTNWRVNGVACVLPGQPPTVIADPITDSVPESTGAGFRVRLSHPPAQEAYLQMTMRGTGRWSSQPVMLRFTPTNWSSWQGFAMGSLPDPDTVDDVLVITLSFPGYLPGTVTFTQIDDD
jgi:hypothetical protein